MISAANLLVLLLSLAVTCRAYSIFTTTCTTPPPNSSTINFVSSPDSRGTLDILWSCLFTIIACTWTIQHLNLPEQRPPKAKQNSKAASYHGAWCDIRWALKGTWSNFKWMLFTVVAPEFILGKALGELVSAWNCLKHVREYAEADGVDWGLAHGFYANMGGFSAIEEDNSAGEDGTGRVSITADPIILTAYDIFSLRKRSGGDVTPGVVSLKSFGVVDARDKGSNKEGVDGAADGPQSTETELQPKLERLPDVTFAELNDKSKGNIFIKIITIVQVLWVGLQIIVRARKGLSISQLELEVAAFSVCAVITYLLLIPKPQGVQVASRPVICKRISSDRELDRENLDLLRLLFIPSSENTFEAVGKRIPNDAVFKSVHSDDRMLISYAYFFGFMLAGMIFGGIHVAGWNLVFPTPVERELWRISSILLTALMPAIFLYSLLAIQFAWAGDLIDDHTYVIQAWHGVLSVVYVAARLFILVEIFRTLLFLPPDAYISTWASNVPHVA